MAGGSNVPNSMLMTSTMLAEKPQKYLKKQTEFNSTRKEQNTMYQSIDFATVSKNKTNLKKPHLVDYTSMSHYRAGRGTLPAITKSVHVD